MSLKSPPSVSPVESVPHPTNPDKDIGTIVWCVHRDEVAYICNKYLSKGQVYYKIYDIGFGLSVSLLELFEEKDVNIVFMRYMPTDDIYEFIPKQFEEDGEYRHDSGQDPQYVLEHSEAINVWEGLGQNIWHP